MHKGKKKLVFLTLSVYCAGLLLQHFSAFFEVIAKEVNVPHVNIVAVLVDDQLVSPLNNDLQRYATNYIQQEIVDSKAFVLPLDLANLDAHDVYTMLENVYFDGLSGVNSSLVGVVLIGEIPLPVVNQDGYIFPTIFPYVDFLDQKYVRDASSQYFIPNGNADSQAEIWHGLIDFDTVEEYHQFFEKIRQYKADPSGFIGDQLRYEDFIASKNAFLSENTQFYQNKLLFAEDLDYQRYTPLMLQLFQAGQNETINSLLMGLGDALQKMGGAELASDFTYTDADGNLQTMSVSDGLSAGVNGQLQTKSVEQAVKKSFLLDYSSLFNPMLSVVQRDNALAGGRRVKTITGSDGNATLSPKVDSSAEMITMKDLINGGNVNIQGVLTNFNTLLEEAVDKKIEKERYDMDIVLPVSYKSEFQLGVDIDYPWWYPKKRETKMMPFSVQYDTFYFGKRANFITSAQELSMYRGTFRNLETLSGVQYPALPYSSPDQNPVKSAHDVTNLILKSIGASYDVFSTQVEANRGYNLKNSQTEYETYQAEKTYAKFEMTCKKWTLDLSWIKENWKFGCQLVQRGPAKDSFKGKTLECDPNDRKKQGGCEDLSQFAQRRWGGASPINLDMTGLQKNGTYELVDFSGFNAVKEIYDIGGSKALQEPERDANSYLAYQTYASPTAIKTYEWLRSDETEEKDWSPSQILNTSFYYDSLPDERYPRRSLHLPFEEVDYFADRIGLPGLTQWDVKRGEEENTFSQSQQKVPEDKKKCTNSEKTGDPNRCASYKEYTYKIIPSVVKNTATKLDELNGYQTTLFATGGERHYYFQMLSKAIGKLEANMTGASVRQIHELGSGIQLSLSSLSDRLLAISGEVALAGNLNNSKIAGEVDAIATNLKENQELFTQIYDLLDAIESSAVVMAMEEIRMEEESLINQGVKIPFASGWYADIKQHLERLTSLYVANMVSAYKEEYSAIETQLASLSSTTQDIIDSDAYKLAVDARYLDVSTQEQLESLITSVGEVYTPNRNASAYFFTNFFHIVPQNQALKKAAATGPVAKNLHQEALDLFEATFESREKDEPLKIPGLNLLTLDRPVDSPRYVTFQSIGKTEIKLIYPDLYKVPVFKISGDTQQLKTIPEITSALEMYFRAKIAEYNDSLRKVVPTTDTPEKYQQLRTLGFTGATPINRSYQNFFTYDDLLQAIGGEKQLQVIAELLYYQNLTNLEKSSSNNVLEDLNLIKKTFNINNKISYVLQEYLVHGNQKDALLIPNYQKTGYEVAYINSDGDDYLQTVDTPDFISATQARQELFDGVNATSTEEDDFFGALEDSCGIPKDGAVMIFEYSGGTLTSPRWDAFKCWLYGTGTLSDPQDPGVLRTPLKIRLNNAEALGPRLDDLSMSGAFDYLLRESGVERWLDEIKDFGSEWVDYAKNVRIDTGVDVVTTKTLQEVANQKQISSNLQLAKLYGDVKVYVDPLSLRVDDLKPQTLDITAVASAGDVFFRIYGTGDACLQADGIDLCTQQIEKQFDPVKDPQSISLTSTAGKSGRFLVSVDICLPGGEKCVTKSHTVTVQPGMVDRFELKRDSTTSVKGMYTKMQLTAFDAKDNLIDWSLVPYELKATEGQILYDGVLSSSHTFNRFNNQTFYYRAFLTGTASSTTIEILPNNETEQLKNTTYEQKLVTGTPVVSVDRKKIALYETGSEQINILLTNDATASFRKNVILQIQDAQGHVVGVDSDVRIRSAQQLLRVGNQFSDGSFSSTTVFRLSKGLLSFSLDSLKQAGEDLVIIEIPGLDPIYLTVLVQAAPAFKVSTVFPVEKMQVGEQLTGFLTITDLWGNLVSSATNIQLTTTKNLQVGSVAQQTRILMITGSKEISVRGTEAGIGYLMGQVMSNPDARPDYVRITVSDALLPQTGLNVMYLNYFGSDWGNQRGYFSHNYKQVEKLATHSEKLITTTTQLVDEENIRQMVWGISPEGFILNAGGLQTFLTIDGNQLSFSIGSVAEGQLIVQNLQRMKVNSERDAVARIQAGRLHATNVLFYVLDDTEDRLPRNVSLQLSSSALGGRYQIWNLVDGDISYGTAILWLPNFTFSKDAFQVKDANYLVASTFSRGSTDAQTTIGIFDMRTTLSLDAAFLSLQDSDQRDEYIGFRGGFKNISLYAEGESVGEATKKFGSELLINLGDPLLRTRDKNPDLYGTTYDGGLGQAVFTDPDKTILQSHPIDFNNDGLKDLVVVYTDGTVRLLKNYGKPVSGGQSPYQDLETLLLVADHIDEVFVGDVDGNEYEDLLFRLQNGEIRVYLNTGGKFAIDGQLVCLNINVQDGQQQPNPSDISRIQQIFFEDMDHDGALDIITNDARGFVKIFYGGKTQGQANYLSRESTHCDDGRYDRQKNTTLTVARFGLTLDERLKVVDNSMVTWEGLDVSSLNPAESVEIDENLQKEIDAKMQEMEQQPGESDDDFAERMENFQAEELQSDLQDIINEYAGKDQMLGAVSEVVGKYQELTTDTLSGTSQKQNVRVPISYLEEEEGDAVQVYKTYKNLSGDILEPGDVVQVTVHLTALKSFHGAFGDKIQGPRKYTTTAGGYLSSLVSDLRFFTSNDGGAIHKNGIYVVGDNNGLVLHGKDQNFTYILDNIVLHPGETLEYSYQLIYREIPLQHITLEDVEGSDYDLAFQKDELLDIKIQPEDGCLRKMRLWVNDHRKANRSYTRYDVDLQKYVDETVDILQKTTDENTASLLSGLTTIDDLEEIANEQPLLKSLLRAIGDSFTEGTMLSIDLSLFEDTMQSVEETLNEVAEGLCNGFTFGISNPCKGLPVPFNQAFLAPGKYHILGCYDVDALTEILGGGVPIFHYPGTRFGLPLPFGKKGPGDEFVWIKGGVYPSMFRIYVAPTLTAQLGIAMCFGPYSVGNNIPSPFADLGGNCIVISMPIRCKSTTSNPTETVTAPTKDLGNVSCTPSQRGSVVTKVGFGSSPLRDTMTNGAGDEANFLSDGFGFVIYDIDTVAVPDSVGQEPFPNTSINIDGVKIQADTTQRNTPKQGRFATQWQGIRRILIDKFIDPQIRYLANNLTKMHLEIKRPDINGIINDLGNIRMLNTQSVLGGIGQIKNLFNAKGGQTFVNDLGSAISFNDISRQQSWLSQATDYVNDQLLSNPFEELAAMFNATNIINVSTRQVSVKVPLIYVEDINAYELYLRQWIDVNGKIIADWIAMADTLTNLCLNERREAQCDADMEQKINEIMSFTQRYDELLNQVNQNILTLQEYRMFPFQLYERVHAIDRYTAEVTAILNNTFGYVAMWMTKNATRFSSYIDTIVLTMNIIKTYQVLVDFSVNWSTRCGTCTNDTYDQYMCKLSFLCDGVDLPIIQIPSFKLPNLIFDLSQVNLKLDVLLPIFNLQPVKIELPNLPNLPTPLALTLDMDFLNLFPQLNLPTIPQLPTPPTLPDLPSFIPNVELALPVLPPAPELPKIPTTLETTLNFLETIGSIYCRIKHGIGFVAESAVKSKIEQLTQRTYRVGYIDDMLNLLSFRNDPPELQGFDYEVSTQLNLEFNFELIFNFLDTFIQEINDWSTSAIKDIEDLNTDLREWGKSAQASGATLQQKVDDAPANLLSLSMPADQLEYVDYQEAKERFDQALTSFKHATEENSEFQKRLVALENEVHTPAQVSPNQDQLSQIQGQVLEVVASSQDVLKEQSQLLANASDDEVWDAYEGMLAKLQASSSSEALAGSGENPDVEENLAFNFSFFSVDTGLQTQLKQYEHPYKIILDNRVGIMSGFIGALETHTAEEFGMTEKMYQNTKQSFSRAQQQLLGFYQKFTPTQQTVLTKSSSESATSSKTLTTQLGDNTSPSLTQSLQVNANEYVGGVLVRNSLGSFTNALYSSYNTKKVQDSFFLEDVNNDASEDIIMRDTHSVYIKYGNQNARYLGGNPTTDTKFYLASTISSLSHQPTRITFDSATILKISDYHEEVKNFAMHGQSFDDISFSFRRNVEDTVAGYLIKFTERVDYAPEKEDQKTPSLISAYVLVLPQNTSLDGLQLSLPSLPLIKNVEEEVQDWRTPELKKATKDRLIHEVVYYDTTLPSTTVVVQQIERNWQYAKIATLRKDGAGVSKIASPWSHQVVAGRQILADDQGPEIKALLMRPLTFETVSSGTILNGFVGTNYTLMIQGIDTVALADLQVSQNGVVLGELTGINKPTATIPIPKLFFTGTQQQLYDVIARDHAGNETKKTIKLNIDVPEVTITSVEKISDTLARIVAELSQDIDQGFVSFQKNRNDTWTNMMTDNGEKDFALAPKKTVIVGETYTLDNSIGMYDNNKQLIAKLDPETGKITIQPEYQKTVSLVVATQNNHPVVQVVRGNTVLFVVNFEPLELVNITVPASAYKVSVIDNADFGSFVGGKAVSRNGDLILQVSPSGNILIPSNKKLTGSYQYNEEHKTVVYSLRESALSAEVIQVEIKIQPFN